VCHWWRPRQTLQGRRDLRQVRSPQRDPEHKRGLSSVCNVWSASSTECAKFRSIQLGAGQLAELTLNLWEERYPFWSQGRLEAVKRAGFFAKTAKTSVEVADKADGTGNKDTLVKDASMGDLWMGKLTNVSLPAPTGKFTLYFNDNSMEELWLALTWGKGD
jgi:hypothetical protein